MAMGTRFPSFADIIAGQLRRSDRPLSFLPRAARMKPVCDTARGLGRRMASFSRLVRLNYLAPDIMAAIVDGTQPAMLTPRMLIECDLPTDSGLQRRRSGFPPRQELALAAMPAIAS